MSQFEFDGWKSVQEMAEHKQDEKLLTRIRSHDLFASEAKYHKICRMQYMQKSDKWQTHNEEARNQQVDLEEADKKVFDIEFDIVEKEVLHDQKISKLCYLRQVLLQTLKRTNTVIQTISITN